MAARLHPRHQDEIRDKISASQLINRLMKHINGEAKLDKSQVSAALGLLKKVVPDLSSIEHSGEIEHRYVAEVPAVINDTGEWSQHHTPPSLQ